MGRDATDVTDGDSLCRDERLQITVLSGLRVGEPLWRPGKVSGPEEALRFETWTALRTNKLALNVTLRMPCSLELLLGIQHCVETYLDRYTRL